MISNFFQRVGSGVVSLGVFFRLVDEHDRSVSLTNVAFIVCVGKVATAVNPGLAELTALMAAMLAYGVKRNGKAKTAAAGEKLEAVQALAQKATEALTAVQTELASQEKRVTQLWNRGGR